MKRCKRQLTDSRYSNQAFKTFSDDQLCTLNIAAWLPQEWKQKANYNIFLHANKNVPFCKEIAIGYKKWI